MTEKQVASSLLALTAAILVLGAMGCAGGDGKVGSGSLSRVRDVTDESFQQDVLRSERPVVVDFWAPWCGPCKAVEPVFADLAEAHDGRVEFVKMDIDENPATAARFDVMAIPTAILFEGGEARDTVVGARPRSHYEQAWAAWLSPPASATP